MTITQRIDNITKVGPGYWSAELPAPKSVKIEVSPRCNYRCGFCALRTRECQPTEDMDLQLFKRITREMREAGVEEIGVFYLGESFMNPPLLVECIRNCKEIGFPYVFLTTNASLCKPVWLERVFAAGLDSLKFSCNVADEEQFREIVAVSPKYFRSAVANLREAKRIRDAGGYKCGIYASSIMYDGEQQARMEAFLKENVLLKAGMTIAAAYTTAVVGMAVLKGLGGTILEENTARTVGSSGGNVAAGVIFTLPAFFISGVWRPFFTAEHYVTSTIILVTGGILGIMFVTVTRRILVHNEELPSPESVAAAEIHKGGQKGQGGAGFLLSGMGVGAFFAILTEFKIIATKWQGVLQIKNGALLARGPEMSAAFLGVGYIIGPKLSGINFSGGVLAWGLLAPAIAFFLHLNDPAPVASWADAITGAWRNYVHLIAIGGMLVGAFYTLFNMRRSLVEGIARSFANLRRGGGAGVRRANPLPPAL